MEKICVAVRLRPPAVGEPSDNASHWRVENNCISLHKPLGTPISGYSYAFDHIFDQDATNTMVYQLLIKDIIRAAVDGFNGTAFAYGQTSSGKTYTMNGSENDPGIIQLGVKDIFDNIKMITDREFLIRVSYMEIYNEEINDLFAPEKHRLQIHESLERGVFVAGLREEIVNTAEHVLLLMEQGEANRHFGQTNMNIRSSRSHTIFRMVIESREKDAVSYDVINTDAVRVSVLNLVDLAGSERVAKTGAGGVRLKEGKYINKSLMVLGNVINKLSEGGKQRAHIPYRDSKLTRILQPALGGNAKTSIICTLAPEEVHVEETKGTLQFASRAKRITNCVQVNEVLTDAALLKRQKLEIEELRRKLQGSHSEVLEQEVLNLRNDMLMHELERERLAVELEEERKAYKEQEERIREQQMKIDNLISLVTSSDYDSSLTQGKISGRQSSFGSSMCIQKKSEEDDFRTPDFKPIPSSFVSKRFNHSRQIDFSPVPENLAGVADEEMWLRLNKGHYTDIDAIQFTPADPTECYKNEIKCLKRQLQDAIEEKLELEKTNTDQLLLNNKLMTEISELQEELLLVREVPKRIAESVITCKDVYKDAFWIMQSFAPEEALKTSLVSSTHDIVCHLFTTLETHLLDAVDGDTKNMKGNSVIQEQCKMLAQKVNLSISDLIDSHASDFREKNLRKRDKALASEEKTRESESYLSNFQLLRAIRERSQCLAKSCTLSNQLLDDCSKRCDSLERECCLLKEEKDSLVQSLTTSTQTVACLTAQKEQLLKDLNKELQKSKYMEGVVRRVGLDFAQRQGLLVSFHRELKDRIEKYSKPDSGERNIRGF